METVRVPLTATDYEIQCKLKELYSKQDVKDKGQDPMQFVTPSDHTKSVYIIGSIREHHFN